MPQVKVTPHGMGLILDGDCFQMEAENPEPLGEVALHALTFHHTCQPQVSAMCQVLG